MRYGCQRLFTLLRCEGWPDNYKRVYQLYCLGRAASAQQTAQAQPGLQNLTPDQVMAAATVEL